MGPVNARKWNVSLSFFLFLCFFVFSFHFTIFLVLSNVSSIMEFNMVYVLVVAVGYNNTMQMMFYVHQVNSNTNRSHTPASWAINKLLFSLFFSCYLHELCRSWIRIRVRILCVFVGTTVRVVLFARRRSRKLLSSSTNKVSVLYIHISNWTICYVCSQCLCLFLFSYIFFLLLWTIQATTTWEKVTQREKMEKRANQTVG